MAKSRARQAIGWKSLTRFGWKLYHGVILSINTTHRQQDRTNCDFCRIVLFTHQRAQQSNDNRQAENARVSADVN